MPSSTEDQARFMASCSHGAGYESCPPQKVSHEFNQADKGTAMLKNAMKHRVKRPMGGPVGGTALNRPPTDPALLQGLQALQARAASNMPPPGGNPMAGMPPMQANVPRMNSAQVMPPQGGMPPMTGMPPMQANVPRMNLQGFSGAPVSPGINPGLFNAVGGGPGGPALGGGGMQPPGLPPSGGALGTLQTQQDPGMMRRPQPMIGSPTPTGPMAGRSMMAGGGLAPPGLAAQSPLPTSPLSSLIGGGMAGMHGGPGLAPHMRKPRIPLPGALRNINQTINHARGKLGRMG